MSIHPTHSCGPECLRDHLWFLFQGLTGTRVLCGYNSHNLVPELPKQASLEEFCHKISDHVAGWTPLDGEFLLFDPVCYKIVPDVDVLRAFTTRSLAIPFEEYGTLVVLVNDVLADFVSLSLDKVACPTDGWHTVIYSHQFCLGGASGV